MENIYDKKVKYYNILNRIQKKYSIFEGFFIIIRLSLTDNSFYYSLSIIFRFIPLIIISGNFLSSLMRYSSIYNTNANKTIYQISKILTCHYLVEQFNLTGTIYIYLCLLIFVFFAIRLIIYFNIIKRLRKFKHIKIWPIPCNYLIINDHIIFLFFPYIIEFLSFSYYIYFFPDKFIIKNNNKNEILTYFLIFLNTLLIIAYNINNYIYMICSNKIYSSNEFEVISKIIAKSNSQKSISYNITQIDFYILIILQNIVLVVTLENYISSTIKLYFKIVISIILLIIFLIFLHNRIYNHNYSTIINIIINILIIFCFYSIIFDFILIFTNFTNRRLYKSNNILNEIIYFIAKLILSYTTNSLILFKKNKFLEKIIRQILFQENNVKNKNHLKDALIYLNEILLKIKEQNDDEKNVLLIKFLNIHINNCNKIDCNCKLLKIFLKAYNDDTTYIYDKIENNFSSNLLIILNYLYESVFIEYGYTNKYDLTILLAEHFCHLRDNPTMSFSFIVNLIIRKRKELTKFQMTSLYELSQKYVYYISAKLKIEKENKEFEKEKNSLMNRQIFEYFEEFYKTLMLSYKVRNLINKYIINFIKILKYKTIFEETLSFQFDEDNKTINNIKINFFDMNSNIDSNFYDSNKSIKKENRNDKGFKYCIDNSNLYNIINILNKEQNYYKNICNIVQFSNSSINIPIFMIYKYYLFFDIFEGRKIPEIIANKLNDALSNHKIYNTNKITKNIFLLLKKLYIQQYIKKNAKFFAIYEYKNELSINYFSEACSLKLGFNQKDIIHQKIDELMPIEFGKSHQNLIKKLLIGEQMKHFNLNKHYLFDSSKTKLFPIDSNGIMIYLLSKNLNIITEIIFVYKREFIFMVNNNFELLAISQNFEKEYFLNQKIFEIFGIKIMNILSIKPEKLNQKFKKEYKNIEYQNIVRQIKPEEYFVPQFYTEPGKKNIGMMKLNNFNIRKKNILSRILNSNKVSNEIKDNSSTNDEFEEELLIKDDKIKKEIYDLFFNTGKIIVHKTINLSINKMKFIENVSKELLKIPDNELLNKNHNEKDNNTHNLILEGKKLINELLLKNELSNNIIDINIKLSYFYDKSYYFIILNDIKNLDIKFTKYGGYSNKQKNKNFLPRPKNFLNKISKKNSRNKINNIIENGNLNSNSKKYNDLDINIDNNENHKRSKINYEENEIMEKIEKYRLKINKNNFIFVIQIILSLIIIFIFCIYLIIISHQKTSINTNEKILLAYFFNGQTRNVLQNIYSKLIAIFHDISGVIPQSLSANYQAGILSYSKILRDNYHKFNNIFLNYNLAIKHSFNLIYEETIFEKLRGKWREVSYYSEYCQELDFIIHDICIIEVNNTPELQMDLKNFLFYKEKLDCLHKANTPFIKLLFYFCINYEFTYKNIFIKIYDEIYSAYNTYNNIRMNSYYILEVTGFLLYLSLFIIVMIFLYFSNIIIIKNIIFLFLDFSDNDFHINKNNNSKNILKLLKFLNVINDFDLIRLKIYTKDLDNINNLNKAEKEENIIENKKSEIEENIYKKLSTKDLNQISSLENSKYTNKNKNINNSSSLNYLGSSDSHFFKDKLNNSSNASRGDSLLFNSSVNKKINNNNLMKNKSGNNINLKNNNSFNHNDLNENFQDIILDRSNKSIISLITIHFIIITLFIVLIIVYTAFKISKTFNFNKQSNRFYTDFSAIDNKYSSLYYYFNTIKTLFVFNDRDKRWNTFINIMINMQKNMDEINNNYIKMISKNMDNYNELKKIFQILTYNKNDSKEFIKENICGEVTSCQNYLYDSDSIFNSGIDTGYKICFTYMNNIFMDYMNIKNKTNINEIIRTITGPEFYEFKRIRKSFSNVFYYVKQKIFEAFEIEQSNFNRLYKKTINLLNLISVIYSILILVYMYFFIFLNINRFSKPIKDSVLKINRSFYYIKTYSFTYYKKKYSYNQKV